MGIRNAQMSQKVYARLSLWVWQRGRAKQLLMVIPLTAALRDVPKARSARDDFTPVQAM